MGIHVNLRLTVSVTVAVIADGAGLLARIGPVQMQTADVCPWTPQCTYTEVTALRRLMVFAMDCALVSGAGRLAKIGLAQTLIVVARND